MFETFFSSSKVGGKIWVFDGTPPEEAREPWNVLSILDGKPILSLLRCRRCRNNAAGWQMSLRRGEFIHFCGLWLIMAYHGYDDTHRFGKNMYEERSLHVYSSVVMIHSPYGLQTPSSLLQC